MDSNLIVPFPGAGRADIAQVGGKAASLIRMLDAGLPVPPGAVLTTEFFQPWFERIQASDAWNELVGAEPSQWADICPRLKELSPGLPFSPSQQQALDDLKRRLAEPAKEVRFAVRSSSPEEDLETASFAGGYETRLGVSPDGLADAIRRCFASSLDERVFVYKRENGLDPLSPRIAVIVQKQVASDISGIGFSLNPMTNDFDEALVEANWGLGESVVAGQVSPDRFVVDKVSQRVIDRQVGAKEASIWLGREGGTVERASHRSEELTLADAQLAELSDAMSRIEELLGTPTDIEWAYANGRLHLLQARPITAYVPLPPEMLTQPGKRRRLYMDAALSKGMTTNAPFSPMELDWGTEFLSAFIDELLGIEHSAEKGLIFFAGGRMYMNFSNMLWLSSPKRLAKASLATDPLMARILASIDPKRYRALDRPPWMRLRLLWSFLKTLWLVRGMFRNMLRAFLAPERADEIFRREAAAYEEDFCRNLDYSLPLAEFSRNYGIEMMSRLFVVTMPALAVGIGAAQAVDRIVGRKSAELQALAQKMQLGFEGNVVVDMGIAMSRLAKLLKPQDFEDLDELARRVGSRRMPDEFLRAWDDFIARYGWRGPLEMDQASPRYADDPKIALRQMSFMTDEDEAFGPEAVLRRHVEERREAYDILMSRLGWLRRRLLRRAHRLIELFAGTRDTPKHQMVLYKYAVRKRALIEGRRLLEEGRLDSADDIFDLTLGDIKAAQSQPSLDLRQVRRERTRFLKKLEAHVTQFPQVIDSRGRILRPPPRQERPGELSGIGVSAGTAIGPVKLLRTPHEKAVEKGDVLVAYTTDPGWTPLFVNASAIVLEVGGILQHGAVIAREYGKPCIVGIDSIMTKLQDGQQVEVDGSTGLIRILQQARPTAEGAD